jgi:hypothetical protein
MKTNQALMKVRPVAPVLGAVAFAISMAVSGSLQAQTAPVAATSMVGDTSLPIGSLPLIRNSYGLSLNWSGYAVSTPDVTSVTGTFTVPEVGPPGSIGGLPPNVGAWVGIDGYTSGTVEQTGIGGSWDDATGTATYYAWWEMFPRNSATIKTLKISAGDSITASVTYNGGGSFTLSITDNTTGQSFTKTASAPAGGPNVAQRSSAEWVVERPATIYNGYLTILPLATFDPEVTFTDASFTASGTTATLQNAIDNDTHYAGYPDTPPAQPYWEQFTMVGVDSDGNAYPLDYISDVTGNSFTASFLDNGTPFPIPGVFRQN